MNRVAGEKATSSQDAQRQQQGQPTAAQQAQGMQPSAKMTDDHLPAAAAGTRRSKDGGPRLLNGDGRANWGPGAIRGLIVSDLNVILWAELMMVPLCCCVFASTGFRHVRNKQTRSKTK
jgi:hypothetical protein